MPDSILYWKGCMSRLRTKSISDSTMELFRRMGVEFKTLGESEGCCGSVLLRTGQIEAAKKVAESTIDRISSAGFKEVVTACPGCFRTMASEYPIIAGQVPFRVRHISQFLMERRSSLEGKFRRTDVKACYHDPCHLGRHMGVYEEPRDLIRMVPGVELAEMRDNRSKALCCGSGGGVRSAYPELSREVARSVAGGQVPDGVKLLITACPFCNYNFKDACSGQQIRVVDLPELLLSAWRG
ncbi:MAG: (Fe-S)-binding protein [Candidatus Methanosuratincola verstraetei]|jgi:heterodisulfide reductase subunit D